LQEEQSQSTSTELIYNIKEQTGTYLPCIIGSVSFSTINNEQHKKIFNLSLNASGSSVEYNDDTQHIMVKYSFTELSLPVERIICDILGCNEVYKVCSPANNCITTIKYHHIQGFIVALSCPTAKVEKALQEEQKEGVEKEAHKNYQSMVRMQQSVENTIENFR